MNKIAVLASAQPITVIEQSVKKLRGAIMRGDLRPGQKLVEAHLCQTLAISRASLRETLRALEAERLIELVPNRGPFVAKLGAQQVEEIHEVWALMTGEIVYRFATLATPAEVAELEVALRGVKSALRQKDTLAQLSATNAFFNYMATRCGNAVLSDMIEGLVSRLNFLRAQSLSLKGWALLCAEEIGAILAAIRSGSPAAARAATRRHITSACAAAKQVTLRTKASMWRPKSKSDTVR
jgi:DNA-binding GntR family transcriptional regulator